MRPAELAKDANKILVRRPTAGLGLETLDLDYF